MTILQSGIIMALQIRSEKSGGILPERKILMKKTAYEKTHSLYDPSFEHDNCGIGAVVNIRG